jgi:pimeloyl-ACP methyl ester carboxylesterase
MQDTPNSSDYYLQKNSMELNTRILGEGKDLIILHGLYGSGDNWLTFARGLAENYKVHLPDQRNHGNSPHSPDHSYQAMVNDLAEYIETHNISSPIIMGHSMGGKTAMWFSILHPQIASSLIVIDISPVGYAQITDPSSLIEQHLNIINGMRMVDISSLRTRNEIDAELSAYIPNNNVRQFLLKSIARTKDERYFWKLNIEAIGNYLPEIMKGIDIEKNAPLINPQLPVLFIKGELSEYLPESDFNEIKKLYPKASIETIYGSGHWVHAEKPEALLSVLQNFLMLHK